MPFDTVWLEIREEAQSIGDDSVLVTPTTERAFEVVSTTDDCLHVEFHDSEEKRTLWRDQFAVLDDRSDDAGGISLEDLPLGVEPYASVLSLSTQYTVDESTNTLRRATDTREGDRESSPFVRPGWEVRTSQERVRDDALLLVDQLERVSLDDPTAHDTETLVNAYVLLSDVQRGANRLRRSTGEELLGRIGPDDRLHATFGTVSRTRRRRHHLKDPETIFEALEAAGIPRDWVVGVDPDKLDVVLTVTDLEESAVYDVEEQQYVQKTDVAEAAKHSRLQGLLDRLERLDTEEAEELQEEIDQLENRLDNLLATA